MTEYLKWGARIILVLFIISFLWMIFKKKNHLIDKKVKSKYNIEHEANKLIHNLSSYFNNPFEHTQKIIQAKSNPKRWKKEEQCRAILEKLYQRRFPSVRPDFLKSPRTGKNLELDCYNHELRIALEYNGKQHYKYCPYFHKHKKAFYAQVHRDNWKRKKCQENGIHLIEVPYYILEHDLEDYIKNKLPMS